jgi:hypothetical protein
MKGLDMFTTGPRMVPDENNKGKPVFKTGGGVAIFIDAKKYKGSVISKYKVPLGLEVLWVEALPVTELKKVTLESL